MSEEDNANAVDGKLVDEDQVTNAALTQQNKDLQQKILELERKIEQVMSLGNSPSQTPVPAQRAVEPLIQASNVIINENISSSPADDFGTTTFCSNTHVTPSINANRNQLTNPSNIVHRTLQDLPYFSGKPEEWPMFQAAYHYSTEAYNYTNYENSQRLHKCLKGEAKEAAGPLLIYPDNVEAVMKQLKFRFGRPEQLIGSQLNIVKQILPIRENNLEEIIPFSNKVNGLVVFLQNLNCHQHMANPTILEEMAFKLPVNKQMDWAKRAIEIKPYPTLMDFSLWLNELANIICAMRGSRLGKTTDVKRRTVLHTQADSQQQQPQQHQQQQQVIRTCVICKGNHKIAECKQFQGYTVQKRWEVVKKLKLCFSCLNSGHTVQVCNSNRSCSIDRCNRRHHKLLHNIRVILPQNQLAVNEDGEQIEHPVLNCNNTLPKKQLSLLFKILPVTIYGANKRFDTYALLDEGSSVSLIDNSILQSLGIKGHKRNLSVNWFGGKSTTHLSSVVDIQISGVDMDLKYILKDVHGVPNIQLLTQNLKTENLCQNLNVPLKSYEQAKPLLLIGLDNCHLCTATEMIEVSNGVIYIAKTKLGWVAYGCNSTQTANACFTIYEKNDDLSELNKLLTGYFEEEGFGVKISEQLVSNADVRAKNILKETTVKVGDRYQAGLLWKVDEINLPDSYAVAERRLLSLERKLKTNKLLAIEYNKIISDYVLKGYARKLSPDEAKNEGPRTWYLPHFAVLNPNKPEKIRMVFDAAAKSEGVSLNCALLKGPQEYRPMPAILFNFRMGKIGVCADIKEMFHQVLIRKEDRDSQRFLWRQGDNSQPIQIYEMMVMIFGAACSPCIAYYVKRVNAFQHYQQKPRAVKAILENHYVDDFVDSFDSVKEAIDISKQVREIHKGAGFDLRKFTSNSTEVLAALGVESDIKTQFVKSENGFPIEKVLGMYWKPDLDAFKYQIKLHRIDPEIISGDRAPTKRELLSIVMSIFDPLGFLSNIMVTAKLLMRETWRSNVGWDETIPNYLKGIWRAWYNNVKRLEDLQIPRYYFQNCTSKRAELHVFVDASAEAFVAVAYWRITESVPKVIFVMGKTKCASLKPMSIPRLELQAAVLGSRLKTTILSYHSFEVTRCVLWSDSKTVINWINHPSRRYTPFVAHRITEILAHTTADEWKWVPTEENVADDATRIQKM